MVGPLGVDLMDCSAGGGHPHAVPPAGPGSRRLSPRECGERRAPPRGLRLITDPVQADHIIRTGQADLVLLGRQLLREPTWPHRAARELGVEVARPVSAGLKGEPRDKLSTSGPTAPCPHLSRTIIMPSLMVPPLA